MNSFASMFHFAQYSSGDVFRGAVTVLLIVVTLQLGYVIRLARRTSRHRVETLFSSSKQFDPARSLSRKRGFSFSIENPRYFQQRRRYMDHGFTPEKAEELARYDLAMPPASCAHPVDNPTGLSFGTTDHKEDR